MDSKKKFESKSVYNQISSKIAYCVIEGRMNES